MINNQHNIVEQLNSLSRAGNPFAFIIDFDFKNFKVFEINDDTELLWQTPTARNFINKQKTNKKLDWEIFPVDINYYKTAFENVQKHIHAGDTYLLNLTMPSGIRTNFSLDEIFHSSNSPYKIYLNNEFVCFSPEIFVRIENGIISSYPMKGTIDANIKDAETILKNDIKEIAEHSTIVDLIRNDLSIVSHDVKVDRFMYTDRISTNKGDLLQMSSQITGKINLEYLKNIGSLLEKLLPAGSICGAPKKKTVEIIKDSEKYKRGYYTGIFGVFDGKNLDSCVLIRFLEKNEDKFIFKSGGGITFKSNCEQEYNELISKIYVPIT